MVDIRLELRRVAGQMVLASDTVRLGASPWLMLGHSEDTEEVFAVDIGNNGPFLNSLRQVLGGAAPGGGVGLTAIDGAPYGRDRWIQDEIEIGCEMVSFVRFPGAGPGDKPFKVLVAAPRLAVDILSARVTAGQGHEVIPKLGETLLQVLDIYRGANIGTWQPKMGAVKEDMANRFGLDPEDFVEIPVLFEPRADELGTIRALAYIEDLVNLLAANGHLLLPEPFYDPFKAEADLKLGAIGYRPPGADGPTLHYIDVHDTYHLWAGEIHCGTNSRRTTAAVQPWWEQQ